MNERTRIALVGYGKMGRAIERLATEHGCEVAMRLTGAENGGGRAITREAFEEIDVAIEFSNPGAAPENLRRLAQAGVQAVTGTTGWFERMDDVREAVVEAGTGLVWSPNYSVGVAVVRRLARAAAGMLKDEDEYGAWAWEIHHDAKKDAPSGTLKQLVQAIEESGYARPIDVAANRAGRHPGTHEIGFDSAADTITLRHVARSRDGFATGALKAARWIEGRRGVFTFDDVLFGGEAR